MLQGKFDFSIIKKTFTRPLFQAKILPLQNVLFPFGPTLQWDSDMTFGSVIPLVGVTSLIRIHFSN